MNSADMFSQQQPPRYTGPIVGSIVLHAAIFAALLMNVDWGDSDEDVVLANVIDAEVVEPGVLEDDSKQEQRRRQEQQRQRQEAEQRQREQQAAEQKAAERQRQEALRIAEEKQRKEEQQRQAEEQRRREEEQRLKAEQERRRQEMLAEERSLREETQRAEWEELQKAEDEAAAQARSRELATQMQLYKQAIKQRVDRNWVRPVSAENWYTCEVIVNQIPGGEIVSVQFDSCDGDAVFQRSVRNAVYKSSPLPDPPDSALFERRLNFTFRVPDE